MELGAHSTTCHPLSQMLPYAECKFLAYLDAPGCSDLGLLTDTDTVHCRWAVDIFPHPAKAAIVRSKMFTDRGYGVGSWQWLWGVTDKS